jgi:acyl dehydratase
VRPGDVLTGRATVERVEPADDHPGGYVDVKIVGTNQDGDVVLSCLDLALVESR